MITTSVAGLAGTLSGVVETEKVFARYVPTTGLVMPSIVSEVAALLPTVHEAPARVIVTIEPTAAPVAVQLL